MTVALRCGILGSHPWGGKSPKQFRACDSVNVVPLALTHQFTMLPLDSFETGEKLTGGISSDACIFCMM